MDRRYGDTDRGRETRRDAQARYARSEKGSRRRRRYMLIYNNTVRENRRADAYINRLGGTSWLTEPN